MLAAFSAAAVKYLQVSKECISESGDFATLFFSVLDGWTEQFVVSL
jgi:hypothetical protein